MKRCIIVLLALLFLTGCLPTPEQEFVVSKSDNILEQKLNATPKPLEDTVSVSKTEESASLPPLDETTAPDPTAAPLQTQFFPSRWDEDAEHIREYVTLAIHADIETKADGLYPVYRTREEQLTDAQVIELANKLLSKPKERELVDALTKDEWTQYFKEYLDEVAAWEAWDQAGRPDDGIDRDEAGFSPEEVEQESQWYMEQIQNAPDKLDKAKVSDYSGYRIGQSVLYTLADGGYASISSDARNGWNFVRIDRGCRHIGYIYRETQYREDRREGADAGMKRAAKQWQEPTLSRADAEATALREIERLGFTGFSIAYGEPANLYDTTESSCTSTAAGWTFMLRRDFDGYPLVNHRNYTSSDLLDYGDGDGYAFNKPISKEGITVFVDETGIRYFAYDSPKTIVGKANANVELLPFEEIVRIVKNTLNVCYPSLRFQGGDYHTFGLEVYRMVLTPYTLRVKDSDDFYEVPCWVVFFDGWTEGPDREAERNNSNYTAESIIINAVDGTVVHEKAGY
ncbi:MAG: hypothetical protein IKZ44_08025 [Clostridia bacterium]|nr:hypothetical protein [Clostridia bacterium]